MTATTGRASALPTLRDASAQAETAYRDAVYAAYLAGATYAELADTLGVSRQAVRQLVARSKANEENMRERLAEIDGWYDRCIDRMTDTPGHYKKITAWQNAQAGKLRRKGLPPLTPVSVRLRDYAETVALKALEDLPDDPRVKRIVAQLDEAASLRKRLTAFDDARMDF